MNSIEGFIVKVGDEYHVSSYFPLLEDFMLSKEGLPYIFESLDAAAKVASVVFGRVSELVLNAVEIAETVE